MHYSNLVPTTSSGQLSMKLSKLSIILATVVFASAQVHANEGAGANAATGSAVGGVSTGVVVAAVAGIAVVAALSSGDSGTAAVAAKTASENSAAAATSAAAGAAEASKANTSQQAALDSLSSLTLTGAAKTAYDEVVAALAASKASAAEAAATAADLEEANKYDVLGVTRAGKTICAADKTCTAAEKRSLSYKAAFAAKTAAENALNVNKLLADLRAALVAAKIDIPPGFDTAFAAANTAALAAQTAANKAIDSYTALAGSTGTVIKTSTGTIGAAGTTGSIKF
jgi:hypothetical protein